jgi:hypothetical protein
VYSYFLVMAALPRCFGPFRFSRHNCVTWNGIAGLSITKVLVNCQSALECSKSATVALDSWIGLYDVVN